MLNSFEMVFEMSRDPMAVLGPDGNFKKVNKAFFQIVGWETTDLVGKSFWDTVVITDPQADLSNITENLSKGHPVFFVDSQFTTKSGTMRSLLWTAYPDYENESIWLVFREPMKLDENRDLFKLAVEASPTAILLVANATIIYANQLVEVVFGYEKNEIVGKPVEILVPTRLHKVHQSHRQRYTHEPYLRVMGTTPDLIGQRKNGQEFPIDIGLNPVQTPQGLVVVCSVIDLTQKREAENFIAHKIQDLEQEITTLDKLSKTDGLTAIKNRRALDLQLEIQYRTAQKQGEPLSFILLDIDNFKHYNDNFGHLAGDEVLKFIAEIMTTSLRHTEIVARYGGEEFGTILPGSNVEEAMRTAERLRKAIEEFKCPFQRITISLGCATVFPVPTLAFDPEHIKNMIRMADMALYSSKRSGKNRVSHFDQLVLKPDETLSDWNIKHETPPDH